MSNSFDQRPDYLGERLTHAVLHSRRELTDGLNRRAMGQVNRLLEAAGLNVSNVLFNTYGLFGRFGCSRMAIRVSRYLTDRLRKSGERLTHERRVQPRDLLALIAQTRGLSEGGRELERSIEARLPVLGEPFLQDGVERGRKLIAQMRRRSLAVHPGQLRDASRTEELPSGQ